jgi:predicted RND superfamily exporter protein
MMQKLLRRGIDAVTEHNRITLLVMILLTAGVVAGIPMVESGSQVSGSADDFQDIDRVQASQYISDNYGNTSAEDSNKTVQPVYVRNDDGNVLSKTSLLDGLRYQQEISQEESVRSALHEEGMFGMENLVAMRAAGAQDVSLEEQIRALENTSPAKVEQIVGQLLSESPRTQQFLSSSHDGSTTATDRRMIVTLDTGADEETRDDAGTALYETAGEYSESGFFVLNNDAWSEASDHFFSEMIELVLPVALLSILLILVFAYRDLVDVLVGMTGVVMSVLWMFGLLGWLGVEAGVISLIPLVLVTGLSIDFGFHVFNRYREQRGAEEGIREPMGRGLRLVSTALVLVTVTASIGFLANLANPLPLVRNLGVTITLGVISALIIFVTLVPALKVSIDGLLERFGLDRHKKALGHGSYLQPVLERTVTLARRAAPVVLVLAVVISGVGGLAWTQLEGESFQQQDGDVAEWKQNIPGPLGWEPSEVPEQQSHVGSVYQPATTQDAIKSRILVEGDVTSASALSDIDAGVQEIEDDGLLIDHAGARSEQSPLTLMQRVAENNDTFAAAFQQADTDGDGVPDQNIESLYDGLYAADSQAAERVIERTDGKYQSVLVTLSLDGGHTERNEIVPKLDAGAELMEGDDQRTATAAGSLGINYDILNQVVDGILLTMIIALAAIGVTLIGVFRFMHDSATLGAITTLPIVLVVGLVIGGMYLLEIPLTLLTALLMSLVIGLGVDYNIHIGDRFADELKAGKSTAEALRLAVTGTGGALLGSTLTTVSAFATIALVPHPQMQSFGGIVVVALLTSFLVSLLVLPSLLVLWSRYSTTQLTTERTSGEPTPQD